MGRICRLASFASLVATLVLLASGAAGAPPRSPARPEMLRAHARDSGDKAAKPGKDGRRSGGRAERRPDARAQKKLRGPHSIGAPNAGRLVGGVRLKPSRHLRVRKGASAWGLPALVHLLQRAAGAVAKRHGGSVMLVGDLSAKNGGALFGHNSHQSGRDADIGFYVANSKGRPATIDRFVAFGGDGRARDGSWPRFDDARNWALVEALLEDRRAEVRYIFVSSALRARLLAHAAKKRVRKDLVARAAAALIHPAGVDVHDDHFHVRLACPEKARDVCVEDSVVRSGGNGARASAAEQAPAAADAQKPKEEQEEKSEAGEGYGAAAEGSPARDEAPAPSPAPPPAPAPPSPAARPAAPERASP